MEIKHTNDGKAIFKMISFLKQATADFPEEIMGSAATMATKKLFTVRDERDQKVLEEERATAFHHDVAQLLFVTMRSQRDIQTAVAYLSTYVRDPAEDEWGKLKRL